MGLLSSFYSLPETHHYDMYNTIVNYTMLVTAPELMVPGFLRKALVHRERPKTKIINQDILSIVFEFIRYRPSADKIEKDKANRDKNVELFRGTWFASPEMNATLEEWELWIEKHFYLSTLAWVANFCNECSGVLLCLFFLTLLAIPIDYFLVTDLSSFGILLCGIILFVCAIPVLFVSVRIPNGYNNFYYLLGLHFEDTSKLLVGMWKSIDVRNTPVLLLVIIAILMCAHLVLFVCRRIPDGYKYFCYLFELLIEQNGG